MKKAKGFSGFTLIEVMAATMTMGLLVYTVSQIVMDYSKSSQKMREDINIGNVVLGVEILLRNEVNCLRNFVANSNPPRLRDADKIYFVDSTGGDNVFLSKDQNNTINKQLGFELTSMQVIGRSPVSYELKINFLQKIGQMKDKPISKSVLLQFEYDASGNFTKCYSDVSKSSRTVINSTVKEACEAMGFIYKLSPTDLDNPTCEIDPAQLNDLECPTGEYLQKADIQVVSGKVKYVKTCKKLYECAAGQVALIMDERLTCYPLCNTGDKIGVYQNGQYKCIDLNCNQTLGFVEYLAGIDATGKICRKLVDATNTCPTGRPKLVTTSAGSLKVECN